jgi:FixJ family two-component response regulator
MESGRRRIAVVEDDESVRRALRRVLETMNLVPEVYASSEEFLDHGEPGEFDCILIDYELGGMNGIELSERLDAAGHDLPRILLTARADAMGAQRHRLRGGRLLAKPVDPEVLRAAIESVAGRSRGADASEICEIPEDQSPMVVHGGTR